MSERPSINWTMWTLVIVAMPVLYILTLPPVCLLLRNAYGWGHHPPPTWVRAYVLPGAMLYQDSALKPVLKPYLGWWEDIIPRAPMPTPPASSTPTPSPSHAP